jgi:putative dehydrogenase
MKPVVAVIAQGAMGAAVGQRLVEHGLEARTSLAGRSEASAKRARAAGVKPVDDDGIVACDFLLSIVPPADALALAQRFSAALARTRRTVFVDCNAVCPETVARIAAVVANAGCAFVDASIIGGPPRPKEKGPSFYASGEHAKRFAALIPFGLDVRVLSERIGDASAIKMAYAGITKGLNALGSAMFLAAARAGVAEPLRRELAESQPALAPWFQRSVPGSFGKAYRWVGEMEEIAEFLAADKAAERMYRGAAEFYKRLAADQAGSGGETAALKVFLAEWTTVKA